MTREGRRCNDRQGEWFEEPNLAAFLSVLCGGISITGSDTEGAAPSFIVKTLVTRGAIAFVRGPREWAAYTSAGRRRRTGFPEKVKLLGDFGRVSSPLVAGEGKDAEVCIIPANPFFYSPARIIQLKVNTLNGLGTALAQNLDALKQATAILYDDPALKGQIEKAEADRLNGHSTVAIRRQLGQQVEIVNFSPNAASHLTELLEIWKQTSEELDDLTGRASIANKQERRTDNEIMAIEEAASANMQVIIDTFNAFADWYGIDAHAENKRLVNMAAYDEEEEVDNGGSGEPDTSDAGDE